MIFSRFELMLASRYIFAQSKNKFVSFISIISVLGISLGVSALIIVLSVMNGFQQEIRNKIVDSTAHIQVTTEDNQLYNWQDIASHFSKIPDILSYAPYIDGQALISNNGTVAGINIRGIDPIYESNVQALNQYLQQGSLNSLTADSFNILIGSDLANTLHVKLGDKVLLLTPEENVSPIGLIPRIKRFNVGGIFNYHMYQFDSSLVFINIKDAQLLLHMQNAISGIRIKVKDVLNTSAVREQIQNNLPTNFYTQDWIMQNSNYFSAVQLEKRMMFIMLSLIVAVASFNMISTLIMMVDDKKSNIAILRTLGATKQSIIKIFMLQGFLSSSMGVIIGLIGGIVGAYYINNIVGLIEHILHTKLIPSDIYYIDYLPTKIIMSDILSIVAIAVLFSIISTIYPSLKAANTDPVKVLRHE